MSRKDFYHLFTGSSIEVLGIKDLLIQENIIPVIKDEGESARLAGFGLNNLFTQDVYVHIDEIEKAKKVLTPLS
jgi:hypothetical protein